ncbi:MAG: hypothetical protein DFNUSKGM_003305, partial [Candidatus Fervidibacter sacchari]
VAIKENQRHQTFQRFEREGKLLMQLSHPNLPKVHEVFFDQTTRRAFLVMDFIDGETLDEMLGRLQRPLTWREARPIFTQVVNALGYLHSNKIIHRDIKPSNIIVTMRNDKVHVFLVDFGVAKVMEAVDPNRPRSSSIVAWTDGYSPPEQYASGVQVDARADQYALAATMVFALTGKTPDDAFTRMEKFRKGEQTLLAKPESVPESVWKAIEVAMKFEPSQRFGSVTDFWKEVQGHRKPPAEPTIFWKEMQGHHELSAEPAIANLRTMGLTLIWQAVLGAVTGAIFGAIGSAIVVSILIATVGAILSAIGLKPKGTISDAFVGITFLAIWGAIVGAIAGAIEAIEGVEKRKR